MGIEKITRITTDDTQKTYEFPSKEHPQLWQATIEIRFIDHNGYCTPDNCPTKRDFVLERQTLVDCGMLPVCHADKELEKPAEDKLRSLLEELLSELGIYPVY